MNEGGRKSTAQVPSKRGHLLLVGLVYVPGKLFGFVRSGRPSDEGLNPVCVVKCSVCILLGVCKVCIQCPAVQVSDRCLYMYIQTFSVR